VSSHDDAGRSAPLKCSIFLPLGAKQLLLIRRRPLAGRLGSKPGWLPRHADQDHKTNVLVENYESEDRGVRIVPGAPISVSEMVGGTMRVRL